MHWYDTPDKLPDTLADFDTAENLCRFRIHKPSELRAVLDKLESRMRLLDYSLKHIVALKLALFEAANNAFRHGNGGDHAKWVQISLLAKPDQVLVRVLDQGDGFEPRHVPDPRDEQVRGRIGGMGLLLLRAYTSWVRFDPPGNQVTFCRRRSDS